MLKKFFAEFTGTAVLVFMGCGSAMVLGCDVPGGHLAVALAFGLSIVAAAYVIGGISGCHINPAVSLSMLIDGRITVSEFGVYAVGQVLGSIFAAALLRLLTVIGITDATGGLGSNSAAGIGIGAALLVEVILTFIFTLTILGVTGDKDEGSVAGIVIGLTLTFVHIVGIPLTGTSVNPARSIGPALFAGVAAIGDVWIFILAPLVGAALSAIVYRMFKKTA